MPTSLSPSPKQQFFLNDGTPAAGGKLYTYAANTTTPQVTYTNSAGTVPNANPIILDARGEAIIYLPVGLVYDYHLHDEQDALIWTREDVSVAYGDANAVSFIQAGDGAVERTTQSKMRDIISVRDYGAVGDGSTDDTLAIQAAIAYVGSLSSGGCVYVPSGQYVISAALTIPQNAPVLIRGDGPSASIIRQTNASADGIVFVNTSFLAFGGGVHDITIEAGAGYESSEYAGQGSSGTGVKVTHGNDSFTTRNLNINNFANGLQLLACWNTRHQSLNILYFSGDGILIDRAGPGEGGGGNHICFGKVSNNGYTGTATASNGVRVRASGGDFVSKIDVTAANRGYVVDPRLGDGVLYGFWHETLADSCLTDGFHFDSTNGPITSFQVVNGWASFCNGNGVRVSGASCRAIEFWGRIRENKQHGILMEGQGFFFRGGSIQCNSRTNVNVYDGVHVNGNVSNWAVQNAVVGNDLTSSSAEQRYGIFIAPGTSNDYQITACKFPGNLTWAISNGGTGTNVFMSGNLPVGHGLNPTNATVFASASLTSPPAGSTRYLGGPGVATTPNNVAWRAPRAGTITQIRADVDFAPGVGQSNTYTLFKNAVATTLTGVISGAGVFTMTATGSIAVAAGDSFVLQVVTSAGAAVANHGYSVMME